MELLRFKLGLFSFLQSHSQKVMLHSLLWHSLMLHFILWHFLMLHFLQWHFLQLLHFLWHFMLVLFSFLPLHSLLLMCYSLLYCFIRWHFLFSFAQLLMFYSIIGIVYFIDRNFHILHISWFTSWDKSVLLCMQHTLIHWRKVFPLDMIKFMLFFIFQQFHLWLIEFDLVTLCIGSEHQHWWW